MHRTLDEVEFVIFDTETTGLLPESGDRVVELAAVRFRAQERIGTFQSLINPQRLISEAAFAVNHISPEMLIDAPTIDKVIPQFLEFIRGSCLCSYNAGFDLAFLNNELKIMGSGFPAGILVVDILRMAKRLLPGLSRYALWFVAGQLGIKTAQQHRAFSDVELTLGVFNKLRDILRTKEIFDFRNFISLFALNSSALEDINNQKIAKIQEAIGLGLRLKMKYLSSSSAQVSLREVVPKEIRQDKDRSYLIAHCCLKNEERSFRIDGILSLEVT